MISSAGASHASARDWAKVAASPDPIVCFTWSRRKLQIAAVALLITTVPATVVAIAASASIAKLLCLAWLLAAACFAHGIGRRAASRTVVLSIDERGILDLRLMRRRIGWHEIEAVFPVNINRSYVVDLSLRWPDATLTGTRWRTSIGSICQRAYGVPAITISMLLLDGQVADFLAAIAQIRPNLVRGLGGRHLSAQPM